MEFKEMHHIAINTSNYDKTIDFYVDKLGFEIISEHKRDRGDIKLDLKSGSMVLEIFVNGVLPERVDNPEAYGLRHLAFKVDSVERMAAELNASGVQTEELRFDDYNGKKMMFFKDPDGLPLEIHE